jgi:hypothetical protein
MSLSPTGDLSTIGTIRTTALIGYYVQDQQDMRDVSPASGHQFFLDVYRYTYRDSSNGYSTYFDVSPSQVVIPALHSNSGTRYVCVDTNGKLVSQTTACSGT